VKANHLVPLVPTTFEPDQRFVDDDPFDSPFWDGTGGDQLIDFQHKNKSDKIKDNAWNYYGSAFISIFPLLANSPLAPKARQLSQNRLIYHPAQRFTVQPTRWPPSGTARSRKRRLDERVHWLGHLLRPCNPLPRCYEACAKPLSKRPPYLLRSFNTRQPALSGGDPAVPNVQSGSPPAAPGLLG